MRLLLATISTPTSSPSTVKPDTSIARLTGSGQILGHSICSGPVKRLEHLESPRQANGPGIDHLREQENHAIHHTVGLRLSYSSNTHTDRTGIEHFQMHFNVPKRSSTSSLPLEATDMARLWAQSDLELLMYIL